MKFIDTLVVGGGVMGASVAYHLALRGYKNILVIDRGRVFGEGSTGKATGGFRCQFTTPINIKLSLLSRRKLKCFEDELGVDSGYRPYGYLFLAATEAGKKALEEAHEIQRQAGLTEVRSVGPAEIKDINPSVCQDSSWGAYCPTDGLIRPLNILKGYIEGARRLGVHFHSGVECKEIVLERRSRSEARITHVQTSDEVFAVDRVVNAAGPWARDLAQMAGIQLDVRPAIRHVAVVREAGLMKEETPMTIFVEDGFHFRVRDGLVLLLKPTLDDQEMSQNGLRDILSTAKKRIPLLSGCTLQEDKCWSGYYEMSPDRHAIVGLAPGTENLYLLNGSSGHGVMHAPALGELLSEVIDEGRASSLDIEALRPSRFSEGYLNPVSDFL